MTWHQWHASSRRRAGSGLSSSRARRSASSPHGYQSTGLSLCCEQVRARLVRQPVGHAISPSPPGTVMSLTP